MPPTSNPTRDGKLGIHEVRFMYTPNRNLIIFFLLQHNKERATCHKQIDFDVNGIQFSIPHHRRSSP